MTIVLLTVAVLFLLIAFVVRRRARARNLDVGAVSTQWLAELRRDEPWASS